MPDTSEPTGPTAPNDNTCHVSPYPEFPTAPDGTTIGGKAQIMAQPIRNERRRYDYHSEMSDHYDDY